MKNNGSNKRQTGRFGKNYFVTRSGKAIKLNRSLSGRVRSYQDSKSRRRAANLSTLPKGRVKRFLARFHPKRTVCQCAFFVPQARAAGAGNGRG